jgi:hypothetical protein
MNITRVICLGFLALPFVSAGCATPSLASPVTQAPAPEPELVAGEAEVVKIDRQPWTFPSHGPVLASGEALITLKITAPERYRDPQRILCAQSVAELRVGDHSLVPGDVISFRAYPALYDGSRVPGTYADLRDVAIRVSAGETKKK